MMRIDANGELAASSMDDLIGHDAIIYGSPSDMGGPAWQFKKFADASSKNPLRQPGRIKASAGFTTASSANGDGLLTILYLFTLSQQHGHVWVGTDLQPPSTDETWVAGNAGISAICAIDVLPDEAPRTADLEHGFLLGKRIAEVIVKLVT
jgi:NAD(P)H dehydrogenase (quinone)